MSKIKKVVHNQVFYIINKEMFKYKNPDSVVKETGYNDRWLQYQWVIPMYVFSINQHWDGTEAFDLCPVNFACSKNEKASWRWKREYQYSEIGVSCWNTEKEAWDEYNKKYSDDNKKVFKEFREIRFIQERNVELAGS